MQYPCWSGGRYHPLLPEHFKPVNKFHPAFPDLDCYLEAEEQRAAGSVRPKPKIPDILLRLPIELSAIIFSFLSPVSLDAARCVSRAWRLRIISDKHILSAVLTPESQLIQRAASEASQTIGLGKRYISEMLGACTFRRRQSSSSSLLVASINIKGLRHTNPTFPQLLYVKPVTSSP